MIYIIWTLVLFLANLYSDEFERINDMGESYSKEFLAFFTFIFERTGNEWQTLLIRWERRFMDLWPW